MVKCGVRQSKDRLGKGELLMYIQIPPGKVWQFVKVMTK